MTLPNKAIRRIPVAYGSSGKVFLYLVRGESIALIDTGPAQTPRAGLEPALKEMGLALSDIDLILNTHAHADHAGGNQEIKQSSKARVHLQQGDLAIAGSVQAQVDRAIEPMRRLGLPEDVIGRLASNLASLAGEPAGVDVTLAGGEVLDLGGGVRLHAMHTPGHTEGSVSYYWETEGVLFTGDAVQGQGARPGVYPLYYDASSYRSSLAAVAGLGPRVLCLGHAFCGGRAESDATLSGAEAGALLSESIRTADTIHRVVAKAEEQRPGMAVREVVLGALSELIYHIPQLWEAQTGMPMWAGPTLVAHLDALRRGDYPSDL